MPRHRSNASPISTSNIKRPPMSGIFQMPDFTQAEKRRKAALHDLVGRILIGPPDVLPVKRSTVALLFGLAIDRLAERDNKTAEALRHCASHYARLELAELTASTNGLPDDAAAIAKLDWLLSEEQTYSLDDMRDCLDAYRRALGKRACYPRTLRRQDTLLRNYARSHDYPIGTRAMRGNRREWVREYLPAMITEAQAVPCFHEWRSLTDQDRDYVLNAVDGNTSLSKLSALVLTLLHPQTVDSLLKRLLPRGRH